MGKYAEIRKDE